MTLKEKWDKLSIYEKSHVANETLMSGFVDEDEDKPNIYSKLLIEGGDRDLLFKFFENFLIALEKK